MSTRDLLKRTAGIVRTLYLTGAIACLGVILGPDPNTPGPRPAYGVQVIDVPKDPPTCLKDGKPAPCSKTTFTGK